MLMYTMYMYSNIMYSNIMYISLSPIIYVSACVQQIDILLELREIMCNITHYTLYMYVCIFI